MFHEHTIKLNLKDRVFIIIRIEMGGTVQGISGGEGVPHQNVEDFHHLAPTCYANLIHKNSGIFCFCGSKI